jgi:two-component system chemotaxis response regulator CheY
MKILLADDAPGVRSFISTVLRQMGYRDVVEAEDGGQAWAALLTDWNMPIMSGLELLEKVRRQPGYEQLPVLIFTGRNTKDDVVNAVRSGASAYLVKPFTLKQFSAKIRELIGRDPRAQTGSSGIGTPSTGRRPIPLSSLGRRRRWPQPPACWPCPSTPPGRPRPSRANLRNWASPPRLSRRSRASPAGKGCP